MPMARTLAVDPGVKGAYVMLGNGHPHVYTMPVRSGEVNYQQVYADWKALAPELIVIENPVWMPKMSRASAGNFGLHIGTMRGMAFAMGCEFGTRLMYVAPQTWKKIVLVGTAKDKSAAIEWVTRAYPDINLNVKNKPHDGIADATCIAEYGLRLYASAASRKDQ